MTGEVTFRIYNVVLQVTTFCNLDCKYCYLPDKERALKMSPNITAKLSEEIQKRKREVNLIWHAGEPLASGLKHFRALIAPLKSNHFVTHVIQTNATLINQEWCDFFVENNFHVGVSIDGPSWANKNRTDRKGKETFDRIMQGIHMLKSNNIKFIVIAVVDFDTIDKATELYDFFCEVGCDWVGINIEENECSNTRKICDDERVTKFWEQIFAAWFNNPKIEIREISSALSWFQDIHNEKQFSLDEYKIDLFPSIGYNGEIVLLSPELLGGKSDKYDNFIVGNAEKKSVFDFEDQPYRIRYIKDFSKGIIKCQNGCEYFSFCKGGQASNKFYETGRLDVTETAYCRNSQKRPVDAIIKQLNLA
jgi:uncharacterized protein